MTEEQIRALHKKEWFLMAASGLSVAVFFMAGLVGF